MVVSIFSATRRPAPRTLIALALCAAGGLAAGRPARALAQAAPPSQLPIAGAPATAPATPATPAIPATPVTATAQDSATGLVTTRYGKKMIEVAGRPTPLFWTDGITNINDLPAYQEAGMNTVVVRLGWRLTNDNALIAGDLDAPRAFAQAAAARGLNVIYSLPCAPYGMERDFRVCADSKPYFALWTAWVQGAIAGLRDTPNLIGWMLPDNPRELPFYQDTGFSKWLTANFANVSVLNQQWGCNFSSLDSVTVMGAQSVVDQWRNSQPSADMTTQQLQAQLAASRSPNADRPLVFHPAALALAQYKWEAYRALLDAWATTVRQIDPTHPVMAGRTDDYAQLLSTPPSIDVTVPDVEPGIAEDDAATHNPQAIDIARRGGRFAAIPVLATAPTPGIPEVGLLSLLPNWADTALAHGASGLAFASWDDLKRDDALRQIVGATIARLQAPPYSPLWQRSPVATTAIVLTPLADGHTLHLGSGDVAFERGLYGFGEDIVNGEPSDLVYALRWGTAFGSIDYLSPDDLGDSTMPLSRYATLLLPQALSVSDAETQRLADYTHDGGVIVSDLGMGAAQSGWQANSIPPALANLFGVVPTSDVFDNSFNLTSAVSYPLVPTWNGLSHGSQGVILTGGDGPDGAAFAGPVNFEELMPHTIPLAVGEMSLERLRHSNVRLFDRLRALLHAHPERYWLRQTFLSLHPVGGGYAIYAPFRLWTYWLPGAPGFDGFHGDLFSRGAALAQTSATTLVPLPPPGGGPPAYTEVTNYADAIAVANHDTAQSVTPGVANHGIAHGLFSTIETETVGDFMWQGAVCSFPVSNQAAAPAAGRPAPIAAPDQFESQSCPILLKVFTPDQTTKVVRLVPVRVQNLDGGPIISNITQDTESSLKLMVWPGSNAILPQGDQFDVAIAGRGKARVTVYDGASNFGYHVAPGSRHHVTFTDMMVVPDKKGQRPLTDEILTADDKGELTIEASGQALSIEISPAAMEEVASAARG